MLIFLFKWMTAKERSYHRWSNSTTFSYNFCLSCGLGLPESQGCYSGNRMEYCRWSESLSPMLLLLQEECRDALSCSLSINYPWKSTMPPREQMLTRSRTSQTHCVGLQPGNDTGTSVDTTLRHAWGQGWSSLPACPLCSLPPELNAIYALDVRLLLYPVSIRKIRFVESNKTLKRWIPQI